MPERDDNNRPMLLVVDDDPTNLRLIDQILGDQYKVYLAPSGERAIVFLEKHIPNLILLDLEMPGMNGYDVMRAIKARAAWQDIPVVFLTGQEGRDKEREALSLGAVDYILKPVSPEIVKYRVGMQIELQAYRWNLEEMVERRTQQLRRTQDALMDILANMTSFRDHETGEHIRRTTYFTKAIVENLLQHPTDGYRLKSSYAEGIIKAARLHDIGKVAVPDNVLLKPARLTPSEFELIKQHSVYGAEIIDMALEGIGDDDTSFFLGVAREIIATHHERWDGTGYPLGLSKEDIPLSGRILAIVDVYDALVSHRPYKDQIDHETAIRMIYEGKGTHFDPALLELSREVIEGFERIGALAEAQG